MKVIIAGGRDFFNYKFLEQWCDYYLNNTLVTEIVNGGARGVDALARRYAKERGYKIKLFPADWDKHGKRAGPLRNRDMANHSDLLIAFWDGKSRGTQSMIIEGGKKRLKSRTVKI